MCDMSCSFEAISFAVDAQRWAHAREASFVSGGIWALEHVVFGKVVSRAEGADDGAFGSATRVSHMP